MPEGKTREKMCGVGVRFRRERPESQNLPSPCAWNGRAGRADSGERQREGGKTAEFRVYHVPLSDAMNQTFRGFGRNGVTGEAREEGPKDGGVGYGRRIRFI